MVFSSPSFLFVFLPVFFLIYWFTPVKLRNSIIFIGSLLFYFTGAGNIAFVLLLSVPLNQWLGIQIRKLESSKSANILLFVGICANLFPLLFYKYYNFITQVINDTLGLLGFSGGLPIHEVVLPAGISFFTFQGLSYLIDIRKRYIDPAPSMVDFGMYHTSFPQLIAGPIVRYIEIKDSVVNRIISMELVESGIIRFCFGLTKKIVLADNIGVIADAVFGLPSGHLTLCSAWLGALTYSLQIYLDFSAYSDMAIGLGAMLGFKFPENFDQPYRSCSVTEFWRRWHMTLSRWFRDYLYIPLGGNRISPVRTYINLFVVFVLCGLWHGAAYTFVVWGLLHGVYLVVERILNYRNKAMPSNLFSWILTSVLVMVAWVFFRSQTVESALSYLSVMFFDASFDLPVSIKISLTPDKIFFIVVGIIVSVFPIERVKSLFNLCEKPTFYSRVAALSFFTYSLTVLADNGFNPFIYFRF